MDRFDLYGALRYRWIGPMVVQTCGHDYGCTFRLVGTNTYWCIDRAGMAVLLRALRHEYRRARLKTKTPI